jgi:hypothetical protein
MQAQRAPLRIVWLDTAYVVGPTIERTQSINQSTGETYEHDVAVRSCKILRKATRAEIEEWRIRE